MQRAACPQQKRVEGIDHMSDPKISLHLVAAQLRMAILPDWPACPVRSRMKETESQREETGMLRGCYNSTGEGLC